MLCDHCHKEILDGAIFCTECGHLIKHEEGVGGDVVPTPSTPVSQAFAPADPETVLPPPVEDVPQPVFVAPQPAFASAPMFAPQPIVAAPRVMSPYAQMWELHL